MAMVAAYFDESGAHDDSNILTVSGVIAPVRQWERLALSWDRLLTDNGMDFFHAADLWGAYNAFGRWKNDQKGREHLYNKFVDIAARYIHWRAWSALTFQDYMSFVRPAGHRRARLVAYSLCSFTCLSRIEVLARQLNIKMPMVFDRGGRGGPFAMHIAKDLIRKKQEGYHKYISTIGHDAKENLIPLQVADLHAYEVFRYFADQYEGKPFPRPEFRKLLRIPQAGGCGVFLHASNLRRMFARIQARQFEPSIGWDDTGLCGLDLEHSITMRSKHGTAPNRRI